MRALLLTLLATGCVVPADTGKHPREEDSGTSADTDTDTDTDTDADGDGDGATGDDDCDDADPSVHPGATETCDGIDQDCDGTPDDRATDGATWYADTDADGHGDEAAATTACDAPPGYVASADDCDDGDAAVYPGAPEDCDAAVDRNCDGSTGDTDLDGDGWAACLDCDDTNTAARPDGTEVCDAADVDEDCDGVADDADTDTTGRATWYRDFDGDGWAEGTEASVTQCDAPAGYTDAVGDCAIQDATISPDGAEVCDDADADEDCDGVADDADASVDAATWSSFYADGDGDGFGAGSGITACDAPAGLVPDTDDCDDGDAAINPDATEVCDAADTDEDCDGAADDATASGTTTWYADLDGDGFGDPATAYTGCEQPAGYVLDATDCDDGADTVFPAAAELCDGYDDDCDGTVDEDDAADAPTWHVDADGDGFGDPGAFSAACAVPAGSVADATDCDDVDGRVYPGAAERCDGYDDDCDGTVDEDDAVDASTWHVDADGDGFGDPGASSPACAVPLGSVADATDCDDADAGINPAAAETCATAGDDDCDGDLDDLGAEACHDWYADADGDGFGDTGTECRCLGQGLYTAAVGGDCDDTDASIRPDATEVWYDGVDEACDGGDDWDQDGDGGEATAAGGADCDDTLATVNTGASETCSTAYDDDCDGDTDEVDAAACTDWYTDADADGYGTGSAVCRCSAEGTTTATVAGDCDDGAASTNPGAEETWYDGIDEDCDGADDFDADADGYEAEAAGGDDCDDTTSDAHPGEAETSDGLDNDCDGRTDNVGAWNLETVDMGGSDYAELPHVVVDGDDAVHLFWAGDDDELLLVSEAGTGWTEVVARSGTGPVVDADVCETDGVWSVVYSDDTTEDIVLATVDGGSVTGETLDTDWYLNYTYGAGDVGVACRSGQEPAVAWSDGNASRVYLATGGSGAWRTTTVTSDDPRGLVLRADSTGGYGLAYEQRDDNDARYASVSSVGAVSSVALDTTGRTGYEPSLAFTPDDRPVVTWWDNNYRQFQAAIWDGSAWQVETIKTLPSGYYETDTAVAVAPDGTIGVALMYGTEWYYEVVDYAESTDDGATWTITRITTTSEVLPVEVSLAMNSWGEPQILMTDYHSPEVVYAYRY